MDISKISGGCLGLQFVLTAVILYDLGNIDRFEGGVPVFERKLVGDCIITPDRGNHRARHPPDKYCSWGEKDTRYWVHALVCHISRKLGISLHLSVLSHLVRNPLVIQ